MDFKKAFGTDEKAEVEGKWFLLTEEKADDGTTTKVQVKIARTGNPRYKELLRLKAKPVQQSILKGIMDSDALDPVLIEVMAKSIVLDWEGFTENGQPYAYSQARAQEQLTKFKDFRDWVAKNADDMQAFREESVVASRGNSLPASSGTSDGQPTQSS